MKFCVFMCALCWIEQFTSLLQIPPLVAFWFSFSVWSHTNFSYAQRVARFSHVVYMCECAGMRSVSIFFSSFILIYFFFSYLLLLLPRAATAGFVILFHFFFFFFARDIKLFTHLIWYVDHGAGHHFYTKSFIPLVCMSVCVCLSLGWWCRMVKWWWWLEEVKKMKMWPVQSRWNVSKYCLLNALWLFCSLLTQNHHI